jgi:glutaredoxin
LRIRIGSGPGSTTLPVIFINRCHLSTGNDIVKT